MKLERNLLLYLKTIDSCNLHCKHCYLGDQVTSKIFDIDKVVDFIKRFHEYHTIDTLQIELHGGEPMLVPIGKLEELKQKVSDANLGSKIIWSMTTNLVYKLTDRKIDFIKKLDGFGTSWDKNIRFENEKQIQLWKDNIKILSSEGVNVGLCVTLIKDVLDIPPKEFLEFVKSLGVANLRLERLTNHGYAQQNKDIFPDNVSLDKWIYECWLETIKGGYWKHFGNDMFEALLLKITKAQDGSTFCRNCSNKLFTLNADGTVAGCPNMSDKVYGNIEQPIKELLLSRARKEFHACELKRNTICYSCPVYEICNGDCTILEWQGDICSSPKSLMKHLKDEQNIILYKEILEYNNSQEIGVH